MEAKKYYFLDSYTTQGQFEDRAMVVLWNDTDGKVERHQTYGWADYGQGAVEHPEYEKVTDESLKAEIQAKVEAWEQSEFERKTQEELVRLQGLAEEFNALAPYQKKGQTVEVVQGRKHMGFVGVVFWEGMDRYERSSYGVQGGWRASAILGMANEFCHPYKGSSYTRIGVKNTEGEVIWINPKNVKVVEGFEAKEPTLEEVQRRLKNRQSNQIAYECRY